MSGLTIWLLLVPAFGKFLWLVSKVWRMGNTCYVVGMLPCPPKLYSLLCQEPFLRRKSTIRPSPVQCTKQTSAIFYYYLPTTNVPSPTLKLRSTLLGEKLVSRLKTFHISITSQGSEYRFNFTFFVYYSKEERRKKFATYDLNAWNTSVFKTQAACSMYFFIHLHFYYCAYLLEFFKYHSDP